MKNLILVSFFILLFSTTAFTQAIAVMKASVTIVSGGKTEIPTDLFLSSNPANSRHGEVIITSSPNTDINIFSEKECTLVNKIGETIKIKTDSLLDINSNLGTHTFSVNATLPTHNKLNGNYIGSMVTTIEYL
jgi:hypothetical protein